MGHRFACVPMDKNAGRFLRAFMNNFMQITKRLFELEKIITSGQKTFIAVGLALMEIKDGKLYKDKFSSFEEYCQSRWGWGRHRALQLIESAEIANELPKTVLRKLNNSEQALALKNVPKEERIEVIEKASENGKSLTAESIKRTGSKCPPKKPKPPEDKTGLPIPPEILEAWNKAITESQEVLSLVSKAKCIIEAAQGDDEVEPPVPLNPTFKECDFTDDISMLEKLYGDLKRAKPFAVCFKCNGIIFKGCSDCKGKGWISEFFYKTCVPEETKKITKR
jgi:hypothetical protein